jgi:TolB-like protein/Tfp pilus assembly protein PilF
MADPAGDRRCPEQHRGAGLAVSWAFELTPEGIKREHEVDRSQSITPQTGKKLNNFILVLMALAIAYLLIDKFSRPDYPAVTTTADISDQQDIQAPSVEVPEVSRLSIAVLPFDNRSNREEDQFFTDGIHDDLLTTIAKIGSMKVISRTSVMEYRGTTKKIPDIAGELGVAHVLEGGIQRSGNQVRINVQLIDAQTDEHLWAEIYDRELTAENLFAIQSEISNAIAGALEATLSPEEQERINSMPTDRLDAYDAYLRGKRLMATRRTADLQQSTQEFLRAVELDPEFALAWVGVADSHMLLAEYSGGAEADTISIRENAIQKALSIDPNIGEAHASLATIHEFHGRAAQAEAAYLKAIELSPNYATAYHWFASNIQDPLRSREQLDLAHKAAELDPRSSIIGGMLGTAYFSQGLYSRGEQQMLKLIELYPDTPHIYHRLGFHYAYKTGEYAKALEQMQKMVESDPGSLDGMRHQAEIYLEIGDLQAAEAMQQQMAEVDADHVWLGWLDIQAGLKYGNAPAVAEASDWMLPRVAAMSEMLSELAVSQLLTGDKSRARELFVLANPGWLQRDEWEVLSKRLPAESCIFSWILLNTGDAELGSELLEQTTAFLERDLPAAIEHADAKRPELCFLTAGDTGKALASLETQLAHNHIWSWDIYHRLPMYELIRHEPSYQAMMAERERRIALQLQAIGQRGP